MQAETAREWSVRRRGLRWALLPCLVTTWMSLAEAADAVQRSAFLLGPRAEEQILRGIDRFMDLDLGGAREAFGSLQGPVGLLLGPYFDAVITFQSTVEPLGGAGEWKRAVGELGAALPPILQEAEIMLREDPENPDLLLTTALIRGTLASVDGARGRYLAAVGGLRSTHALLRRTLAIEPGRVDALWALGVYEYWVSQVPLLLKPLVRLLLPRGNRATGLARIREAAERGRLTRIPAQVTLLRIHAGREENWSAAVPYAEALAARYPASPEFRFLLAFLYSELGRAQAASGVADAIHTAIERGEPTYPAETRPRYWQLLGKLAMD
ncbi:MAG: tetratricopeptide repeat protein, partial [Candidatus Methylomirabilales bacterium]